MKIEQAYAFVNEAQKEILGEQAISLTKDLTEIVDVGDALANVQGYDAYVRSIANRIGKMLFVSRVYTGRLPKVLKDSWEFGSIIGKLQAELIDATENESWKIVNGATYDPYVVNLPVISSKFWNKMTTFEIDITLPEDQVKQSFASADEMMRFLAMIETQVNNSMEIKIDALTMGALVNFIGGLLLDEADNGANARVVHLLTDYNTLIPTPLSAGEALVDKGFLQYATAVMIEYKNRLAQYSRLFNIGGKARHTPSDLLHFVVHSTFATRAKTHLESDTFHKDLVSLPLYEEVAYWSGTGTTYALADTTAVAGVVEYTTEDAQGNITVHSDSINDQYVIGVMFDHEALGVLQPRRKVKTIYNPKGEYFNNFHKWESRQFNDFNENGVVFLLD